MNLNHFRKQICSNPDVFLILLSCENLLFIVFKIFILPKADGLALCITFLCIFHDVFVLIMLQANLHYVPFLNLLYYIYQKAKIYLFFHACCITKQIIFKNFCLDISTAFEPIHNMDEGWGGGVKIFLYIYK